VRAAACLTLVIAGGCSPLLGIQDPSSRGDAGGSDTGIDGSDGGHIDGRLELSLGDVKLARDQIVNLHVRLIHSDNTSEDVTDRARLDSSNTASVTAGSGHIDGLAPGTATVTATLGDATVATLKATVTAFTCHPVINEFATGSAARGADDEFVEIYNPCAHMVTVEGWTLDYRGPNAGIGALDAHQMITLTGMMMPGDLRLYAGSAYQGTSVAQWASGAGLGQNDGAVGLRSGVADLGPIVDSVAYGTVVADNPFLEGNAAAQVANGKSAARLPFDGRDDDATAARDGDNALDFTVVTTPTPNKRNAP